MSRKLFAKRTSAKHVRPDVPKQLVLPHRRIETENALTRQETTVVIVNTKEHISTAKGPYPKLAIQRQQSTALREPRQHETRCIAYTLLPHLQSSHGTNL